MSPPPSPVFRDAATLLPDQVDGFRPVDKGGYYDRSTLYDLIDGGAEVFLALNVRAVVSRRYAKPGVPEVLVDVFDMGTASDAFGAYHHDLREGEGADIGHESEVGAASLFFWKDRYYVSVVAFAHTKSSREAVLTLGKAVADRIEADGEPPAITRLLPPQDLVPSQVHYFHTWQLLGRHYEFGKDNLLGLGADTEGVLARYQAGDAGATRMPALLIVRYPSAQRAEAGRRRFSARYLSGVDAGASRKAGGWAAIRRHDALLTGVFDASSEQRVEALLAAVERRATEEQ